MACRIRSLLLACTFAMAAWPAAAQVADLVGTWKGSAYLVYIGDTEAIGTGNPGINFPAKPIDVVYVIKEQHGNRFAGEGTAGLVKEAVIGALQPDNRGGIMLDDKGGQRPFTLRDPNTMEMCYGHVRPKNPIVACFQLTRSR